MEKKVGVYVCAGCGIGESVDIEKLTKAAEEYKVQICRIHKNFCGEEGAGIIKKDVADGVNTVVIAACSPRVKTDVFYYDLLAVVLERVNLREHVVWCQPQNNEDTQMMAEDYLRMGIAKAQKSALPVPNIAPIDRTVLVVGGGTAGITAALESANTGYSVVLVEKEAELGGWARKMYKVLPTKAPFSGLEEPDIEEKVRAVLNSPKIRVFTKAKIESIEGEPGMYDATISCNGNKEKLRAGAIILAVGWRPYDAAKLEHLGYGRIKNVITNVEMEKIALEGNGKIARPSDGRQAKRVAFIQCAGQRDEKHLPYCSSVCCMTSLKQALYITNEPEAHAYIIYKDMRTPGLYENFYKTAQNNPGIMLTKGEVASVEEDSGNVLIEVDNTILGEKVRIEADMLVLATGMVTNMVPEDKAVAELTPEFIGDIVEVKTQDGIIKELKPVPIVLNLKYRQSPEVPHLKYGFPDSHFICFPYETRRTGIYAAGAVRHPADFTQASADGTGAALKAIQCVELASQGKAVHPRAGDQTFPNFALATCTQCRRCTVECPFGTLDEDEKGTPKPHPYRCRRCGVCMGACPQRIISFENYSVDIISSMIKAIKVPEEEDKPRIVGLICENDAYPALDIAGLNRLRYSPFYRFITLRCLGGTNLVWVADALSKGVEGILLIGCKHGDDYQCHFIKGSQMADERLGKVQETLGRLQLEAGRVMQVQLSINEWDKLPKILDEFAEKLKEFGPNPFKGF